MASSSMLLCLEEEKNEEHLLFLVRRLEEVKNTSDHAEIVKRLKTLLSSSEDKWKGICILSAFLRQCDAEIFVQNAGLWIKSLLQLLTTKIAIPLRILALQSIKYILKQSPEFDELARDFAGTVIQPLVRCLLTGKTGLSEIELDVIEQCIMSYPGPSGKFRMQIEKNLICSFSLMNDTIRRKACRVFSMLPRCGSGGERGTKFGDYWNIYLSLVINTTNSLIFELFGREANYAAKEMKLNLIKFKAAPASEPEHSILLGRRICALLCVLKNMLSSEFPSVVALPLEQIMNTLCNVFNNCSHAGLQPSLEQGCIQAVLPCIQEESLAVLAVLVAQCGSLLFPYATSVMQIVALVIQKSNTESTQLLKANSRRHVTCYQLLCVWLNTLQSFPPRDDLLFKILDTSLRDIQLSAVKLNTYSGTSKKAGKKKNQQKKLQSEITAGELSGKKVDNTSNNSVAFAALKFLEITISNLGSLLTTAIVCKIQNQIISVALQVSESSVQYTQLFSAPYGSKECRRQLYETVFALTNMYHHHAHTNVSRLITILHRGTGDTSANVSRYCQQCIIFADKIIRPCVPSSRCYLIGSMDPRVKPSVPSLNVSSNSLTNLECITGDAGLFRSSGTVLDSTDSRSPFFRPWEAEEGSAIFKYDAIKENGPHEMVQEQHDIEQEKHDIVQEKHDIVQEKHDIVQEKHDIVQERPHEIKSETNREITTGLDSEFVKNSEENESLEMAADNLINKEPIIEAVKHEIVELTNNNSVVANELKRPATSQDLTDMKRTKVEITDNDTTHFVCRASDEDGDTIIVDAIQAEEKDNPKECDTAYEEVGEEKDIEETSALVVHVDKNEEVVDMLNSFVDSLPDTEV